MPSFVRRAFSRDFPKFAEIEPSRNLTDRILSGGYPEALARTVETRRQIWLQAYTRSLAERDITTIATLTKHEEMIQLIDYLAVSAGQLLNLSKLGAQLSVDGKTVKRWLNLLEQMFLIRRVTA